MEYLLFIAYLILFAWLVTRTTFFRHSELSDSQLVIFFLIKVMSGIFYGWIGIYYGELAMMVDTWSFHYASLEEYVNLKQDPGHFFSSLFQTPYEDGYLRFFESQDSWWNDLKRNFMNKLLAIFNLLSGGEYYTNVIFLSFITMFGPVAFYRVMSDVFPTKKIQVMLATFLLPSFLYWTGGIHKEGLLFMALALATYSMYFMLKDGKAGWSRMLLLLLSLVLLLLLRNFILVLFVPALFAWWLAWRLKTKKLLTFGLCYLFFCLIFFTARFIHPLFDFPQAVINKQQDFAELSGNSAVPVLKLDPTVTSFAINAPNALLRTAARPYPSDIHHILSLAAACEIAILLLLAIILIFWHRNGIKRGHFMYFCIFFSVSMLLSIGYTVNFIGAIVRYRSIILPFLVVPMIALIDWRRIGNWLFPNIIINYNR